MTGDTKVTNGRIEAEQSTPSDLESKPAMSEDPITVLFVDDDAQWAQYMATELELEDPAFRVHLAQNVNEAVVVLGREDDIDCIVTDFRMPEITGIELLEHLQTTHPHLPSILTTGEGSEDIAAQAIAAGVTDYIRKDPLADQATIFINRIRQAVDHAKLQSQVRESEARYRTVTEHTRDAIVILQNSEIVFTNTQFERLCDDSDNNTSRPGFWSYLHNDSRAVVEKLLQPINMGTNPGVCEIQFVRHSGEIRYCELLGEAITYEGDSATLFSIRDVTRRHSREQTLKREREFNKTVKSRLLNVQTRDEIESVITTVLSSYDYDVVWIGTVTAETGTIHTRTTAGDTSYISQLENTAPIDHGGDPILWCAQTGEPQFVPDFETLMATDRQQSALENGLRTGYAVPLQYNGISYGILGVYHRDTHQLNVSERSLLREVADTVGFALHHTETQQTLTNPNRVVVTTDIDAQGYYLFDILREQCTDTDIALQVTGTQLTDSAADTHMQYFSFACPTDTDSECVAAIDAHPSVRSWNILDSSPRTYQVTVAGHTPESHLRSVGALVRSTTVTSEGATIVFELASRENLQSALDRLRDAYDTVTVRSITEQPRSKTTPAQIDFEPLTEKQRLAIETAYHQGYFDRPRRRTAIEIAESIGITHTTFLQHLRIAEQKLCEQLFGN